MMTFDDFEAAKAAQDDGQSLCGTYVDGKPTYFFAPSDASEDDVQDLAFEVRNGRPMSGYEKFLLSAARELHSSKVPA